jgi:hypothetical protein
MINKEKALELFELVLLGYRHPAYERTVELADEYFMLTTGKGQEEVIKEVRPNEPDEHKAQRAEQTNTLTPFAITQVKSMLRGVRRTDGIKDQWKHEKGDSAYVDVKSKVDNFYEENSLFDYLLDLFEYYTFTDPNAFLVLDFKTLSNPAGVPKDIIFDLVEVRSRDVLDFTRTAGAINYVLYRKCRLVAPIDSDKDSSLISLDEFYIYAPGVVYHLLEMSEEAEEDILKGYEKVNISKQQKGGKDYDPDKIDYYFKAYKNKTKETPAITLGVYRDPETFSASYASMYEPARYLLKDLIRDKSLFDLAIVLHHFPQKYVYGPKCDYRDQDNGSICDWGRIEHPTKGYSDCPNCRGKGILIHVTEQDVIEMALPENGGEFYPLNNLVYYVDTPTPEFMRDRLVDLVKSVFIAVFNTELYEPVRNVETATKSLLEYGKIYDTFEPFSGKVSLSYMLFVRVIAQILGKDIGLNHSHLFPKDYKLRPEEELIRIWKASEGLPYGIRSAYEDDLIAKIYRGNSRQGDTIRAYREFLPWKDKTESIISLLLGELDKTDYYRLIYLFYDQVVLWVERQSEGQFLDLEFKDREEWIKKAVDNLRETVEFKKPLEIPPPFGQVEQKED